MELDLLTLRTLIDETVRRAVARTPVPKILPGTIVNGGDPYAMTVLVDGDTTAVWCQSLFGPIATGQRVMVIFYPPAGALVMGFIGAMPQGWGTAAAIGPGGAEPPSGDTLLWEEDFADYAGGAFAGAGWTGDAGWTIDDPTNVLYNIGAGPLILHRDTTVAAHRVISDYKVGASPSSVSGVICCVSASSPASNYVGFEPVRTAGENKLVTYYRSLGVETTMDETAASLSFEQLATLRLEHDGDGQISSYFDDTLIHSGPIAANLVTNTRVGFVQFSGGGNWYNIQAWSI